MRYIEDTEHRYLPSSSSIAHTCAGALSANRSLSRTASTSARSASVNAEGITLGAGARGGPNGLLSAARHRYTLERGIPVNADAALTPARASSCSNAGHNTALTAAFPARSWRESPRAHALFP